MPLKWEPDKNPYVFNYFTILDAGPNTSRKEIVQLKKRRLAEIVHNTPELDGHKLTQNDVEESSKQLGNPKSRAEELLLVHTVPQRQSGKREYLDKLKECTIPPRLEVPPSLRHPLAIFCFIPTLESESVPLPNWDQLELVDAGDAADRELDIVFDA